MSWENDGVTTAAMQLTINGEAREVDLGQGPPAIATLLSALGLGERRVAVEVNERVIRRALHNAYALRDGDVVEIIHFVGGG